MLFLTRATTCLVLTLGLALASSATADPGWLATSWFIMSQLVGDDFSTTEPPGSDIYSCHPQVQFVGAGGYPSFHIEVTGHCATVPSSNPPPDFSPPWKDVRFEGTYDYETGEATEKVRYTGSQWQTLYDVNLQCQPGQNPFIYTGSCSPTSYDTAPLHPVQGSFPLSGPRLDGTARQTLIAWEAQQGQEEEDLSGLVPTDSPPTFESPTPGQSFLGVVEIDVAPAANLPKSLEYVLEFRLKRASIVDAVEFESKWGSVVKAEAELGAGAEQGKVGHANQQVATYHAPDLTAIIDWNQSPDGITIPTSDFGTPGDWEVRARMNLPGARFGPPVPFSVVSGDLQFGNTVPGAGVSSTGASNSRLSTAPASPLLGRRVPRRISPALRAPAPAVKVRPPSPRPSGEAAQVEKEVTPNAMQVSPIGRRLSRPSAALR